MSQFDKVKKAIDDDRNIKKSSLNSYVNTLKKIWRNLDVKEDDKNSLDYLEDIDDVLDYLKQFKNATIRTNLACILVGLNSMNEKEKYDDLIDDYQVIFDDLRKEVESSYKNGKKSEKQEKKWVSMSDLKIVLSKLKKEITDRELFKKDKLNKSEMNLMQDWVIANLYIGDNSNPPSRLDYANMKIINKKDFDKLDEKERKNNNYLVLENKNKKNFVFNDYKTSGKYGENIIKVGKQLDYVLNWWLHFNKSDHLLMTERGYPLSANGLGKRIPHIFKIDGKKITLNLIRSIYVSEKIPKEELDEKSEVAKKMMHSTNVQENIYSTKK